MGMTYSIEQFGELEFVEVYDFYDGPRFFSVRDRTGAYYAVYSCDYRDGAEGWLYLPISEKRLDQLRRREMSVFEAYSDPEKGYWLVYTHVRPRKREDVSFVSRGQVTPAFLPPSSMYVEHVEVVEDGQGSWSHELKIEKDAANTTPSAEAATEIFEHWTGIMESIMNVLSKSQQLHFARALPGSLEVKVGATNTQTANAALEHFANVIHGNAKNEKIVSALYHAGLEPYRLRDLFETIRREGLIVSITPRVFGEITSTIVLSHEESDGWISLLEPITSSVLGTDKVPQADEIGKILKILSLKSRGVEVTPELLGITSRQVRYYEDAAGNLGLLDKNGSLTSIGRFVDAQTTEQERMSALAIRFESSDCGWSWIRWSGGNSLKDLREETAADFLKQVAPGLSESTAERRAVTLRKWLGALQPYHYRSAAAD